METTIDAHSNADTDLVRRAQAGDQEAFGTLVQRYMRRAYFAALGLVGSHDDALDLSQDAFIRAYRARERIDPERPFYAWLYQILRRLCFNHLRDNSTRRDRLQGARPWIVDEARARAEEASPSRKIEREEVQNRVRQAIEQLSDRDREILVLKEFEGLRYREIAELLGIPLGTVMSRLYAARRRLAASMEEAT